VDPRPAVLAIDQGTSATKAVVWSGEVLAEVDVPVEGLAFSGDAVEQDPQALLASIVEAGRQAIGMAQSSVRSSAHSSAPLAITAIGLGNQGETVLAWNPNTGQPLSPAISWQDRRAQSVTQTLPPNTCEHLRQITGLPVDPYFAAPKMAWLQRNGGFTPGPDCVITTIDAFLTHWLTGSMVTDASTASRTQLMDGQSLQWSADACAAYDLDPNYLPAIVSCDATIGTTDAFGPAIPVTALMVDQQAALFAQGCTDPGTAKCTYGTGAFLLGNIGPSHHPSRAGLATSIAWAMADGTRASCVDGQIYSAGAAVSWLQRVGLINAPTDLDALAMAVTDEPGLTFTPTFAGAGAPTWDPTAQAAIDGVSLGTSTAHLVRAFLRGLADEVAALVRAVEVDLGAPLHALQVDGGLTRSSVLMQMQADATGIPVSVYPYDCATALGIAAMALRGALGPGAERAIIHEWTPTQRYEPKPR